MIRLAIPLVAVIFCAFEAKADILNPDVTQDNLQITVCTSAYLQSIRPPTSYTQEWERKQGGNIDTVVDHNLPLCAGGNPTDTANYRLQLKPESYRKDTAERLACKLLCSGKITLKQAQQLFW
jgi:hypothetical protein